MSESDKKLKACSITTFYSPYLFWVVFDDDIPYRNDLQSHLNQGNKRWIMNKTPQIGELALVCFEDEWCRAEIIKIENNFSSPKRKNIYTCFLIDYGRFITTFQVYKVPQERQRMPPIAVKGMLYGLTPYVTIHGEIETDWLPAIRYLVETIISSRNLQYFYIEQKYKDVIVGDVILENDKSEKCSLSKEIIARNFAVFDSAYDVTQIKERPISKIHSLATYLMDLKQSSIESIGSISTRSFEAMTREMNKRSVKIRDNYFGDIDNVLTRGRNQKKTQKCSGKYMSKIFQRSDSAASIEEDHKENKKIMGLNVDELSSLQDPIGRGKPRRYGPMSGRERIRQGFDGKQKSSEIYRRSKSTGRNFGGNEKQRNVEKLLDSNDETYNYQTFEFYNKDQTKTFQQLCRNSKSPENATNVRTLKAGNISAILKNSDENSENMNSIDKGKSRQENVSPINTEKSVTSGRGFRKIIRSDENVPKFIGRGKPTNDKENKMKSPGQETANFSKGLKSESENEENMPKLKSPDIGGLKISGIGFRRTLKSESESDKDVPKSITRGKTNFSEENESIKQGFAPGTCLDNKGLKTAGRGFRNVLKSESESGKDFPKFIGRGRPDFEKDKNETVFSQPERSSNNEILKTSGRGFRKLLNSESGSDRDLPKPVGRDRSKDFDEENSKIKSNENDFISVKGSDDVLKTSGHEFLNTLKSDSGKDEPKNTDRERAIEENDEVESKKDSDNERTATRHGFSKIIKSESESERELSKTGRINPAEIFRKLKKIDTDSDTSFRSTKSSSSSDQFQDAETSRTSDSEKKSLFRNSPVEEVSGYASGSNFIRPRVRDSNFHEGKHLKRPPQNFDFGKNYPDHETRERTKKIAGLCKCSNCEGWRTQDCVIVPPEEKPKKKESVEKPQLLFKENGENIAFPLQKNKQVLSETEKLAAPRVLVHSCFSVAPVYDLPSVSFHDDVQMALKSMNYTSAHSIQVYTWPAILRAYSAIIVSVPDCGKTMVYVPALCNFLNCKRISKSGPQSIVLCPTVSVVEDVYRLFNSILKRIDKDERVISVPYYNNTTTHKISKHNYDIVVTTPRILIKLYKDDLISLQNLCHIVLEEAHILFALFQREINYVMSKLNNILETRTSLVEIQVITITQEWSMQIENFARKFKYPPMICIGEHLEAALYGRANIKVHLCNETEKAEKVINLIKDEYKVNKTLILYNDMEIPRSLISILDTNKIPFETLTLNSTIEEINSIKKKWMMAASKQFFVLICSDNIFNTGLAITDADVIVQYSLPENWSQFTFRFSGFLDNYSSPLNSSTEDMKKSMMHIMMDNVNIKPYPKLLKFLHRMKTKITDVMASIYENLQIDFEKEKIENKIALCEKFICFDACKDYYSCKYRHMLCPKTDVSATIPKSGLLKLKVLHVESPMKYSCRLLTHTDAENNTHEVSDSYALIAAQLLSSKDKMEIIQFKQIKVGMVCAVLEIEGISKGNFQRCKILEDAVYVGFNNKKVLVRYIDLGFDQVVQTTQLYKLPINLLEYPPQSVTVFIADVAPLDYDTTWAQKFMTYFKREFRKCGYSQSNCYFTGRIKLQIGEAIFIDDLKLQELVEDDSIVIHKMSAKTTLRKMKGITKINQLEKLYKLCEKSNIPLENYNLPMIKVETKAKPQSKPQWAHLENLKEFNQIYFVSAVDPSAFFVKLSANVSLLNQLHKDIKQAMDRPHYPTIKEPIIGQCYALYDPDEDIYARIILKRIKDDIADCFFVDYGDMKEVDKEELKFLPEEFITRLPFQAIECKLFGVLPENEIWAEEASDLLYYIALEPNTDILRYLYVKVMSKEPAQYTGYKKYSVILADVFKYDTIINNVLVEQGLAVPVTEYPIKIDFDTLKESIVKKNVSDEEVIEKEEEIEEIPHNDEEEEINEDDDKWDLTINNPDEFFKMLCIPLKKITNSEQSTQDNELPYTTMKALPNPDYSTPDIIWQQTETHVTMRIQIPSVNIYETRLTRSRIFIFRTECNEINYALNLNLFAKVENFEHSNMGLYILIRMKKIVQQEWPRLIFGKEKLRNIKYNVVAIPIDEESDDDRPITQKMIQSSKTLGSELNKMLDDENAPYIYEYGSDIDWEESDFASDKDSDAS